MGAAYYINQLKTKVKKNIDRIRLIVGDFNTPLTAMDRSPGQKINKESRALNDPLDQMDFIDIEREHSIRIQQNIHSSQVHMELSLE